MAVFDVFNGDADGLCALQQWRLAQPCAEAQLITGVKRDICLLDRVQASSGDTVNVFDVSMKKNMAALERLLAANVTVHYFDHHQAGKMPQHANLFSHIDLSAETCTGLLLNQALQGQFLPWAVVAAFGDNLAKVAQRVAKPLGYTARQLAQLERLGQLLNYNGYGVDLEDLYYKPDVLYRRLQTHVDPFTFIAEDDAFTVLDRGYEADMALARQSKPISQTSVGVVYHLPAAAWSRRVSGVFSNELACQQPDLATAMISELPDGCLRISVRAPLNRRDGAADLCSQFPTGGGRAAAAGINALPVTQLDAFLAAFEQAFAGASHA